MHKITIQLNQTAGGGETSVIAEEREGLKIHFPPSDLEYRLENSESLEGELKARLGTVEEEVDALKIADTGNVSRSISGKIFYLFYL